ncbi:MAG: PEP-CTERM sorting domain-containing protein [Snowella sp.]|nr:PEP-CTERM sorting domain-containing protein [Snowella sp.]
MQQLSAIIKTLILTGFSALSLWTSTAQAASFRGLGFLSNSSNVFYSVADDVSGDGSVIVGYMAYSDGNGDGYEAFRWTQSGGMVGLGYLSVARGVSADGSVIVGIRTIRFDQYEPKPITHSIRWTESGSMVLPLLPPFHRSTRASDVSGDGSVIIGYGYFLDEYTGIEEYEAFRWTESGGMVGLGDLRGDRFYSVANDVSGDGSVIVGTSINVNGYGYEAFRWTESGGMVGLGDLPGGDFSSSAEGVSADGSVIVGQSQSVNGTEAFRWTESGGMVGLGDLPGGDSYSYASGVSADGSIVVGYSEGQAFRWTQETGMVSLKETLIGAGLDVSGWSLTSANAISADGFTIVGNGTNPSGQSEVWVANLSPEPVPEPLTILGSMAAIAFAAGFERKFNKNKSDEKDLDA